MKLLKRATTGFFYCIVIFSVVTGCNTATDNQAETPENTSEPTANTGEESEVFRSADSWQSWVPPEQLSGYSLKNFITNPFKMEGLYSASARYEKGEQWLNVQIIDAGSDKGKREARDHFKIAEENIDHSSEYGYEKTLERNGIKAKEEYLAPPAGQYLIKFMLGEQYGVSVKSNAKTAEEIWELIDQLKLEALSK